MTYSHPKSDRERLLELADKHSQESSKFLRLHRTAKRKGKPSLKFLTLCDEHADYARLLKRIARKASPKVATFRDKIQEQRLICGAPVGAGMCSRNPGHSGVHRSAGGETATCWSDMIAGGPIVVEADDGTS